MYTDSIMSVTEMRVRGIFENWQAKLGAIQITLALQTKEMCWVKNVTCNTIQNELELCKLEFQQWQCFVRRQVVPKELNSSSAST
jgi:hypothetical protein